MNNLIHPGQTDVDVIQDIGLIRDLGTIQQVGMIRDEFADVTSRIIDILNKISPYEPFRRLAVPGTAPQPVSPRTPVSLQAADLRGFLQIRARRRSKPAGQFLDGCAWDMLIDLAAVRAEGGHVSVSAICITSGAPQSTALRKLAALEAAKLVERYLYGSDRRRVCLTLTEEGAALVRNTIEEDLTFLAGLDLAR